MVNVIWDIYILAHNFNDHKFLLMMQRGTNAVELMLLNFHCPVAFFRGHPLCVVDDGTDPEGYRIPANLYS